ncbi:CPBP family intramembrane metalloprotease [Micromonospora sp. NBC_01699]|uniref:CPBP family intramembrane glutamic endopeptidase n=1 Tax=Micromonospora sp. NBC_01699 TaxID=2975984 RepID=UPI002E2E3D47|nr:CPBP family intramembrane glutamic endopeptidase [Micromonospora sp. NBC_01699]
MDGALELTTHILVLALLAIAVVGVVRLAKYRDRFRQRIASAPDGRSWFYRHAIINAWIMAAFVPLIVLTSAELTAADVGWAWPHGDGLDYLFAAAMFVALGVGGLLARYRMRRGHAYPGRSGAAAVIPRTATERRLAVAVSFTAGITEEALYRGLLIAVGTQLYDLPLILVAAVSLALFVAAHVYQGRLALLGVAYTGALLTAIYLISGSLLLAIVVHIWQDLVALLLVPPHPTTPPPAPRTNPDPPPTEPAPHAPATPTKPPSHTPPKIRSPFPH